MALGGRVGVLTRLGTCIRRSCQELQDTPGLAVQEGHEKGRVDMRHDHGSTDVRHQSCGPYMIPSAG